MGHNTRTNPVVDWSPPRYRRRSSRAFRWCLIFLAVFAGSYLLLTRSFVTRWIFVSRLGGVLGGEASAQRVRMDPGGGFEVVGLKVRAPGVEGDAGIVLACDRIDGKTDFWRLVLGEPRFFSLFIDKPLLRISQDADTAKLNWASLTPRAGTMGGVPATFPQITVHEGAIELGQHRSQGSLAYDALRRIPINGVVERAPDATDASIITFRQQADDQSPLLHGSLTPQSLQLSLSGMEFQAWPADAVPAPMRDLYRRMNLQGTLRATTFVYDFAGTVSAKLGLADVAVSLPLTERPETDNEGHPLPGQVESDRWLRLERVNGELTIADNVVRATLQGTAEELPCDVSLVMDGLRPDAPFTATLATRGFQKAKDPVILRYAHGLVRYRLRQFSDPTGLIDAEVTVTRGSPTSTGPGELSVGGLIRFREGKASFFKFPYRFEDLSGEVAFSDDRVDIRRVEGVAPTGAHLVATGWVAPLNNDPGMEIRVRVTDIPYDDALEAGMLNRRKALDAVFSKPRYQELLARGLVATPAQHREARARLDALPPDDASEAAQEAQRILDRPVFELGGPCNVDILVIREEGVASIWHDTITIEIPRAGILPEHLPYPMWGEGVTIVKDDAIATVRGGTYRGLRGGTATIDASIDLDALVDDHATFVPDVRIEARGVPLDDRLTHALPNVPVGTEGQTLAQGLARLHLAGEVDIDASLGRDPTADALAYRVQVTGAGIEGAPVSLAGEPRLSIRNLAGRITVDHDRLDASLTGDLESPADQAAWGRGSIDAGLRFDTEGAKGSLSAQARIDGLSLAAPLEDVVSIVAPEAALTLDELRQRHDPAGLIDLIASAEGTGDPRLSLRLSNARDAAFTLDTGRVRVSSDKGTLVIRPAHAGTPGVATFENVHARLNTMDQDDGLCSIRGAIRLDATPDSSLPPLEATVQGARFESPLVRALLGTGAGERGVALVASRSPRGRFDLDAVLTPTPQAWHAAGTIYPRSLALTMPGGEVAFAQVDAPARFTHEGLSCETFTARCDDGWSIRGEASLGLPSSGGMELRSSFNVEASSLTPSLRAALPTPVLEAFNALSLSIAGPMRLEGVQVALSAPAGSSEPNVKVSGRLEATALSGEVGLKLSHANTRLDFTYDDPGNAPSSLDLKAILDSFRLSDIAMTQGRLRVTGSPEQTLNIPLISADCHAGRLAGTASITSTKDGPRAYAIDLRLSDVRFANVLRDLEAEAPDAQADADEGRGLLSAGVNLRGVVGDLASRQGRGQATILGGRILKMPLLLGIVRMSNLQLPLDERIDFALVDFFIDAADVLVEQASVQTRSVTIYGFGTASWPDLALDMRFRSRAKSRIPVLSSIVEGIRDELVTIQVGGTVRNPEVGVTSLPATSRLVKRSIGLSPSEQEQRLNRIEERLRQDGPLDPGMTPPR